jgi:DNA-binding transcriptional LysR family regulator
MARQPPGTAMNLKEVEAFRAIMLSGSMTAAANDLYTSQPNVSRLLARLEKSLGLKLFNRVGGRLVPTEEGQAFYREVERSFIGLQSLESAAKSIREFGTGRLRVAAAPSYSLGFLPRVLRQFLAQVPSATVSVHTNSSTSIEHWTASQFCDIGLASLVSDETSVVVERLPDMKACACCHPDIAWPKRRESFRPTCRVSPSCRCRRAMENGSGSTRSSRMPRSLANCTWKRSTVLPCARWWASPLASAS